ncbi:FxsB family cyclophane-forming radical SAM/SPASM peptide maturase [Dactylosporangium sp. NPDC051541]|uniref:FxsB family cyclophane-forming radical SAM/SPASM peptide maturase n=1 Tax=Dactylosporangium sp. NPDC051541 TaxID=3363977 RepID=UPI003791612D
MPGSAVPISQVILKLNGRCNLKCSYCYIYEHIDQSWQRKPAAMSDAVIAQAAQRLADHAGEHRLDGVEVVLHGGEPLLAGPAGVDRAATILRDTVSVPVSFTVQTNGTLINDAFLEVFRRHAMRVGVSLDGGEQATDRHRRYADGRGSFSLVARGLNRLRAESGVYAGVLATIDTDNEPVQVYEDLLQFAPPRIDLLLPHGTWDRPPPGRDAEASDKPYARWLIAVFDRWYDAPVRKTSIRLFESICDLLLGGPGESEAVGLGRDMTVTIEPDGSIGHNDFFKITSDGGAETGLNVFDHDFADVLAHPAWNVPSGLESLCATCKKCSVVAACGGGLRAHRFRAGSLDNPSVYCPDLLALIKHIQRRLTADLERLRATMAGAEA